jgi:adenylate cyclase
MATSTAGADASRIRLLAVLAADAAGYSRLMSLDDRGTVAMLDASRAVFRAEITRQAGRVIDMAGDSVLAVFDNASAAVSAALALQQQLLAQADLLPPERRMHFRIGVHLGDVIEKEDGTVYGDGVNIAARLQSLAVPGGVLVSDAVRGTVKGRLGASFQDQGEQQVKNIADPLRAFRVLVDSLPTQTVETEAKPAPATAAEPEGSGPPGIAVLPFDSVSDMPEQAWVADGLVDDIIGSLASVPGLVVIARSSTFSYKGRAVDARTVGRELGVRYVLEGGMRIVAQRMRLNVRLIDSQAHDTLWSERFDAPMDRLFDIQDEITAQVMNAVRAKVGQSLARESRRLHPQSLQAWQLRAQLIDHFYRWNRVDMLEAKALSRRIIELAPAEAEGHARLAVCLWAESISGWSSSGSAAIEEAMRSVTRALNLDAGSSYPYVALALLLTAQRRHDEAIVAAERACELAPGDFSATCQAAQALAYAGRYEEALPRFDLALRLSPKDPLLYTVHQVRAMALFGQQRYAEMVGALQRVSQQLPEWIEAHTLMAVGFVGLREPEQAGNAIANALRLDPRLTVRRVMRRHPLAIEADVARLAGFLRAAGLADQ